MQGWTARDGPWNRVRIIEFIRGADLLSYVQSTPARHEEYCHTVLPRILANVAACLLGIQKLHEAGLCHGDIRNDHLLIERATGEYKWIDFDLNENSPEFDNWSAGNILHCVAAKGFLRFRDAVSGHPELSGRFTEEDASVFFPYRIMNLRKVYPYLPARLNKVLLRFSVGARSCYETMSQVAGDVADCAT